MLSTLLEEGDESAMVIQEFEDQVIQVCQDSPELSMAFSAYQEARSRLRDKVRNRGFWPPKPFHKGKGKGKKGKGYGKRRLSLAERIATSSCRKCGAFGHWKDECPNAKKNPNTADANMMVSEQDQECEADDALVSELPHGPLASWQARKTLIIEHLHKTHDPCLANEEFGASKTEFCMHVDVFKSSEVKVSKDSRLNAFALKFRTALETSFGVVRSRNREIEDRTSLGPDGTGIIDTGASKSVIGEKRVNALLATLKPRHQNLVKWQPSETVFRFGNNGILKSMGALFVPFGSKWMKIEVVQGHTPFLISNAFLYTLNADLLVSQSCLRVPTWNYPVKLNRNKKGLFFVKLADLIEAAGTLDSSFPREEVITLASSTDIIDTIDTHSQNMTQQQPQLGTSTTTSGSCAAATVAQRSSASTSVSGPTEPRVVASHVQLQGSGPASNGVPQSVDWTDSKSAHGISDGSSIAVPGRPRDGCDSLPRCEDHQAPDRRQQPERMECHQVPRGQMEGLNLHGDLQERSQVCELHDEPSKTHVTMGSQLPGLLSIHEPCGGRNAASQEAAREGDRDLCPSHDDTLRTLEHLEGRTALGDGDIDAITTKHILQETSHGGRDFAHDRNYDHANQGGKDHSAGHPSARDGKDSVRVGESVSEVCNSNQRDLEVLTEMEMSQIHHKIEEAMVSIEKDLEHFKATWSRDQPSSTNWKLDILEIYCTENSEITRQAQNLGLKAKRFTFQDGDLSTVAGRKGLWKIVEEERPREIWVAPDCKYWGNYSRRNMGRSISTADKILAGREDERTHLTLCNDLYLHQMSVGGQFHLEQPQGSEAPYQPELRDMLEGTLCTTFDMCEVGKLLAPGKMRRVHGNNFLRKRTTVFTSSRIFHEAFDHRFCSGNHQHVPIAGKISHLGKWISLSEYAARYSSGFGRNVARYVSCRFRERPLDSSVGRNVVVS